jgi:putative DNA primase/helicase
MKVGSPPRSVKREFLPDAPDIADLIPDIEGSDPNGHQPAPNLLSLPGDHEGHARAVLALYPGKFLFCDAYGWMYYNGRFWQTDNATAEVKTAIIQTLIKRRMEAVQSTNHEGIVKATAASAHNINGTLDVLKSKVSVSVDGFDQNPDLLNVQNGVLDLKTGTLTRHSPEQRFTYACPVDYDPQADQRPWLAFLESATEYSNFLQIAVGYAITGHTWEEVMFYVYGPTRSGKGTFTETLLRTFGARLATEADFVTFTAPRTGDTQNFDLAPLKPCRFVAASESDKNTPLNAPKIKTLTGGNYIRCAFKHRDHFSYRPQFKIWLSSNHPVNVDVDDDAAWGRLRVISFPNSHLDQEDKRLKHKLMQDENLRGVLAWAIEGARHWYAIIDSGGLPYPAGMREIAQAQRATRDYIRQFLDECMDESDPHSWIPSGEIYEIYSDWCKKNGVPEKKQNQFSQSLHRAGYPKQHGKPAGSIKVIRYFSGLKKAE